MELQTKVALLVKYGEVSLRKGNRKFYEQQIMNAIRRKLKGLSTIRTSREQGRFLIEDMQGDLDVAAVYEKIKFIFGITGFCVCLKTTARDISDLKEIAVNFYKSSADISKTFKVITKRSDKTYPLQSNEISSQIGECILNAIPSLKVDVHNPELIFWIEIRNNVYFYVNSYLGVGGLPYGASGKGVLLLSGGIDSPIAGYLTARRGVEIYPIYFHSAPYVSERAVDKVRDLAGVLSRYTNRVELKIVPFTEIQLFLQKHVHEEKLTIMLKRSMLRIASAYADIIKAQCLITGDSIGQVASQTLQSIAAVDSAASHAVIRPLATYDKQQIIDISREIGCFDISIRPYEDCCTLFVAKHPESKPNKMVIERIEDRLESELAVLVKKALDDAWVEII